jgi:DNA-binding MarR family transcriptional regulator
VTGSGTRGPAADSAPPPDGLAEGIARLRRALRRGARVADPGNTLAVAQFELLAALAEHPGTRPGQLARRLNMRPNTVTTIVNALGSRGMLERVTAPGDRRAVELTVTEAGREAVLAWQATNAAVLHLALSTLPARQRRALAAAVPALDALARAIDRLADNAGSADSTGGAANAGSADSTSGTDNAGSVGDAGSAGDRENGNPGQPAQQADPD